MSVRLSAAADGLSGSIFIDNREALKFKPNGTSIEFSHGGSANPFMTVDANGLVTLPQTKVPIFQGNNPNTAGVTNNVTTKLNISTVLMDNMGWWDAASTRYIPKRAGVYRVNVLVTGTGSSGVTLVAASFLKNGTVVNEGNLLLANGADPMSTIRSELTHLVSMNGTTDYIEPSGRCVGAGTGTTELGNFVFEVEWVGEL